MPGRKPNAHHYHQCYQQPSSQRTEQKAQKTPLYRPCGNQFRPSDGKLRYTYIIANNHCGQRHQCKQQQSLACQEAEYLILCATHSQAQSYLTTAATGTEPKRSDQSQEYIYQQEKHYNCLTVHLVRISVHDFKLQLLFSIRHSISYKQIVYVQSRCNLTDKLCTVIRAIGSSFHTKNDLRPIVGKPRFNQVFVQTKEKPRGIASVTIAAEGFYLSALRNDRRGIAIVTQRCIQ